jgi:hypothetical protein
MASISKEGHAMIRRLASKLPVPVFVFLALICLASCRVESRVQGTDGPPDDGMAGRANLAHVDSFIGGGSQNAATVQYAVVGGGMRNTAGATRATVGGGYANVASALDATVSGGGRNAASGIHGTIGGGSWNTADGYDATVGGGSFNLASGTRSTVGGGSGNIASDFDTTVAGGAGNIAGGTHATVGGGLGNKATGIYAMVGGGYGNSATGDYTTIPGGSDNQVAGDLCFAAGRRARIAKSHDGTFLFADSSPSDFNSESADEFAVRATGGVRFVTALDEAGQPLAGVRLSRGSGSWSTLSAREAKENLMLVDTVGVLEHLADVPLTTWNYVGQDPSIRHLGPMAQDFRLAFGLGEDDRHIGTVDADGVALAAIQGLYQLLEEKDERIDRQERQILSLTARVAALEAVATASEPTPRGLSRSPLVPWLLGAGVSLVAARLLPPLKRS